MRRRARFIYNPSSGKEEARRHLASILERLEEQGIETSCYATRAGGGAADEAARVACEGYDLLLVAGGDGTLYDVVNGLAPQPFRPPLGILPMGTSNDFARAMGIPRDVNAALQVVLRQKLKAVDIGKMNQNYFIHIAGAGKITELTYEVPSSLKTRLGQMAYLVKGFEKLANLRPVKLRLQIDDERIEEEVMFMLVANTGLVGQFAALVPQADPSDGYLDVMVVPKMGLPTLLYLATLALRGEHVKDPHIRFYRAKRILLDAPGDVLINLDGELGGKAPAQIEILPMHLQVFVP